MAGNDHSRLAHGVGEFAAIMLIIGGTFEVIQSITALFKDEYLVVLRNYVFSVDLTAWGWIHLLVGLALVAVGIFLLRGSSWARVGGIVIAAISALINFSWLPYSPWWAILAIGVDIMIIWALASTVRGTASPPEPQAPARRTSYIPAASERTHSN